MAISSIGSTPVRSLLLYLCCSLTPFPPLSLQAFGSPLALLGGSLSLSLALQCFLVYRVGVLLKNFVVLVVVAITYFWRPYLQRMQVGTILP